MTATASNYCFFPIQNINNIFIQLTVEIIVLCFALFSLALIVERFMMRNYYYNI